MKLNDTSVRRSSFLFTAAVALSACTASLLAQAEKSDPSRQPPPPPPGHEVAPAPGSGGGPLEGPAVDRPLPPGFGRSFGGGEGTTAGGRFETPVSFFMFNRIIRDFELSPEQSELIDLARSEYEFAQRDWMTINGEEYRRVLQTLRAGGVRPDMMPGMGGAPPRRPAESDPPRPALQPSRPGQAQPVTPDGVQPAQRPILRPRPAPDGQPQVPPPTPEELEAAQKRFKELSDSRPKAEPYIIAMWDTLTVEQQTQFQARLKENAQRMREQAARRRGAGPDGAPMMNPDGTPLDPANLSPEDQRRLERIRRRERGADPATAPEPAKPDDIQFEDDGDKEEKSDG